MEEKDNLSSETFNLTKETITVKEVANICKKYNHKIKLRETNDEIPNLGFSFKQKDHKYRFKFLYGLEESIKEMIEKWSKKKLSKI